MSFILLTLTLFLLPKDFPGDHPPVPKPGSFEYLRPKWGIKTNSATDYSVIFKAYNSKTWCEVPVHLKSVSDAHGVILQSELELRLKYAVGTAVAEALGKALKK